MVGKTTIVHKLQKSTIREEYNNEDTQRQRPLILFFATRGGYIGGNNLSSSSSPHAAVTVEATTSHTHSLSLSRSIHTHYTTNFTKCNNNILCPRSYLYIYDFRVIYMSVLSNQSVGSEPGLRSSSSP